MLEKIIDEDGESNIPLRLSNYWKEKISCPGCRKKLKLLETKNICEICGFSFNLKNGILRFGEGDDFYDENGFTRTGRNFSNNLIERLGLYYARQHHLHYIDRLVSKGCSIIELGCGGGSRYLASQYEILGIELSSASAQQVVNVYESVIQGTAISLPLENQSADAIVSSFLLEHLDETNAVLAMQEMFRVLKPNGILIHYFDLDTNGPFFNWAKKQPWYQEIFVDSRGHVGLRSFKDWEKIFNKTGFQIEEKKFSCKTWLQDLSVWAALDYPSVKGWPKLIGKLVVLISKKTGWMGQILLTIIDDCVENILPDSWAAKVILVLRKQ